MTITRNLTVLAAQSNSPAAKSPAVPVAKADLRNLTAEEISLLDRFAGRAMAALIGIGAEKIHEEFGEKGFRFNWPDSPRYFGLWEPSDDPKDCQGVEALAADAFDAATTMLRERRRVLADAGVAAASSSLEV